MHRWRCGEHGEREKRKEKKKRTNKKTLDLGWIREALPEERTRQLRSEGCTAVTAEQEGISVSGNSILQGPEHGPFQELREQRS